MASNAWYRSWWADLAVRLLYFSGLLHVVGLWRKFFGRKRLIVLLYHRLAPRGGTTAIGGLEFDDPVPVDRFARHLRLLRWFGEPSRLDDAVDRLQDASYSARTLVAVTFDDGYRDNYTLGRPVWNRLRVPVTIYPAVAPVEDGAWLWWDELQQMAGAAELDAEHVRPLVEVLDEISHGPAWNGDQAAAGIRETFARFLFQRMVDLPVELRDTFFDELARCLRTRRPSRPAAVYAPSAVASERLYMNWQELGDLADEGVQIGGHTIRHPRLPRESTAVAESEIAGCRAVLQAALARPVTSFAFPGGFYETRELELLSRAGFSTAVTVEKGVNYAETNPLRLRRISLSWDEPHHLAFKLAFADWVFPSR